MRLSPTWIVPDADLLIVAARLGRARGINIEIGKRVNAFLVSGTGYGPPPVPKWSTQSCPGPEVGMENRAALDRLYMTKILESELSRIVSDRRERAFFGKICQIDRNVATFGR